MRLDLFQSPWSSARACVAQPLMRTFFMIMMHEGADRRSEVRFGA
jgi:hypothetical protein